MSQVSSKTPKKLIPQKSIFLSMCFWGAVLTFIEGIRPLVTDTLSQGFTIDIAFDYMVFFVGFAVTILGRMKARSSIYTPKFFPGPDKKSYSQLVDGGSDR